MKAVNCLSAAGLMAIMAAAAQADLLIAWDSSTNTNGAYHVTGISGNVYVNKAADSGASTAQSTDGTYGSLFAGAATSPNWAVSLGTNNAASTNNQVSVRIVNNTGKDVLLDKIHFDISGNKAGAPRDFELRYAYGNLDVTGGTVIASFSNPALAGLIGDYQDYDISLTGMSDCVLADGQSATFTLIASNATGTYWAKIDNIAFSGTVIPGPWFLDNFQAYTNGAVLNTTSTNWVKSVGSAWTITNVSGDVSAKAPTGGPNITTVKGTTFWPAEGKALELDLDYTQTGASYQWHGFVFNYQNSSNYYVFRLNRSTSKAQLYKVCSGTNTVVFEETFVQPDGDGAMTLIYDPSAQSVAISVVKGTNEFIKVVGDTTLVSGGVGLYSSSCAPYYVRNFYVHAEAGPVEMIADRCLQRGVNVYAVPQPPTVQGSLQFTAGNGLPYFYLAQWSSQQSIYGTTPVVLPSGAYQWSNAYKKVTLSPVGTNDSDVALYVDSIAEYNNTWRTSSQPWPHLLVSQTVSGPGGIAAQHAPWLSEMTELQFNIDALLKSAYNSRKSGYNSSLHAAQFVVYFTVQNLKTPGSPGYGDYYWFGMKLYDDRYAKPGLYQNYDGGTSKFIYNIGIPFTETGMTVGTWKHISGDLLPYVIAGFNAARAAGALPDSGNLSDYKIGGMNMGWEVPGLSQVEMQFKNFQLRYVK